MVLKTGYGGNYFEEYGGFDSSAVFEKYGRGGTLPFSVCMQARRFLQKSYEEIEAVYGSQFYRKRRTVLRMEM